MMKNLVLFDFDGTLTRVDTTVLWGAFVAEKCSARHRLFLLLLAVGLARVRLLSNTGLKRTFARLLLRGQGANHVRQWAREFDHHQLDAVVDKKILAMLRAHVENGDDVHLVSANLDCLLEPLLERWSLTGLIATQAECRAGVYSGGIVGAACHGREKLRRAVSRFGAGAVGEATAYGNPNDAPLLQAARTAYLVRRAKPAFPFGRLRQHLGMLSGKPVCNDPATISSIELLHGTRAPQARTTP